MTNEVEMPDTARRRFVSALTAGSAASLVARTAARAQGASAPVPPTTTSAQTGATSSAPSGAIPSAAGVPPSAAAMASDTHTPPAEPIFVGRSGSDYMVDAIRQLDIDYIAALPGSSFRGLHESLINYGGDEDPELLTCLHEEASVALAHGYAKVAGKPMAVMLHGVVGLQHGSMAIYNAWCDRVPILMIVGNALDATKRRQGAEWDHSALDNAAIVRDFTKWDAQPVSLQHFSESLDRAYALAVTPPSGPVLLAVDGELQEQGIPDGLKPPALVMRPTPPVGDPAALERAARLLIGAQNPVIVADRLVRSQDGMARLVELAELLAIPVVDRYGRLNMPTDHFLNQTAAGRSLLGSADVILGLELSDPWGTVNTLMDVVERHAARVAKPGAKLISITAHDLLIKSNFQDFQRYQPADLQITGDGEATLPYLIEAARRAMPAGRPAGFDDRAEKFRRAFAAARQRAQADAQYAWDAQPVAMGRLFAELWPLVKESDWALVGGDYQFRAFWPMRLWDMNRAYQFTGGAGGAGVGYCAPAAVGAALAHRDHGRLVINVQGDGDLMIAPSALWTAAHHKIPLLTVMHNNRAYHQEMMHVQRLANRHERGVDRAHIGTEIDGPAIDYAMLAKSMGVWSAGPVTDPAELAPVLRRAIDVVKQGEPALVDVVCQGR